MGRKKARAADAAKRKPQAPPRGASDVALAPEVLAEWECVPRTHAHVHHA
jgi:hypothetical protein